MDPFSITGTLIAVLQITSSVITICYDYRHGSKNASREVIQISDELSSLKDVLDALLRLVEQSESSNTSDLSTFELLARQGGPLENCQIELKRLKGKLEPETGWRKMRQTLVWPLKEGEMRKALDSLERLKSTISLALSTDQTALALAIRDDVADLTQLFQRHSTDQQRHAIHKWLAAPDPYANHIASRKKRQPRTGNWFLNSTPYESWLTSPRSLLWMYGKPGSGKSVLCSTIIENLIRHCERTPRTALAYFYFDYNDAGKRDMDSLLKSMITQLSAQSDTTPLPLLELYQNHKNGAKSPSEQSLIETFRNLILTLHNVYIVFDALDESSECIEVLEFITTIHAWELSRLHVLATSRQLPAIEEALSHTATSRVCLQDSHMNEDITLYISDKLENDRLLAKWPPEIRSQIRKKLLQEEDGMFQWVVCQLDMLKLCVSIAQIRVKMTTLAKSLDETYYQILNEIDEIHQAEVMKTLQALTATVYPLGLEQIVEIIAVDLESLPPRFDKDSRLLDPRSILSMCSSLVTYTREIHSSDSLGLKSTLPKYSQTSIRLAHASVADYLTQPNSPSPSKFHFSNHEARQSLAQTCMVYLLNPEFATGHTVELIRSRLREYPLLSHCVKFWPMYLKRYQDDPEDHLDVRTKELLTAFFETSKLPNGGNFACWVGMLIPSSPINHVAKTQPLYYAASYGLTDVVRIILETDKDLDIDALGGRATSSALHVAVYRNQIEVVKLLLAKGANPNLPNTDGESPLYWSRVNRNHEMRHLLVKAGAKNNDPLLERFQSSWTEWQRRDQEETEGIRDFPAHEDVVEDAVDDAPGVRKCQKEMV